MLSILVFLIFWTGLSYFASQLKNIDSLYHIVIFIIMWMIIGLRHNVGLDYPSYEGMYNDPNHYGNFATEPIWHILNDTLRWFDFKSRMFFLVSSGLYYISNYIITISACGHIAKTSIYRDNNLRFYEGIIHEDYPFMLQTYHFTNKMGFSKKTVYNYDIKPSGTITSTKSIAQSKRSLESWIYTLSSLQHVFENTLDPYSNEAKKWLDWYKYLALAKLARCNISLKDKRYYLNRLKMCNALKITQYDKFDISRCIICRIYKQILPLIYHPHRQYHPMYNYCECFQKL